MTLSLKKIFTAFLAFNWLFSTIISTPVSANQNNFNQLSNSTGKRGVLHILVQKYVADNKYNNKYSYNQDYKYNNNYNSGWVYDPYYDDYYYDWGYDYDNYDYNYNNSYKPEEAYPENPTNTNGYWQPYDCSHPVATLAEVSLDRINNFSCKDQIVNRVLNNGYDVQCYTANAVWDIPSQYRKTVNRGFGFSENNKQSTQVFYGCTYYDLINKKWVNWFNERGESFWERFPTKG